MQHQIEFPISSVDKDVSVVLEGQMTVYGDAKGVLQTVLWLNLWRYLPVIFYWRLRHFSITVLHKDYWLLMQPDPNK